jgi:hypothetical protein
MGLISAKDGFGIPQVRQLVWDPMTSANAWDRTVQGRTPNRDAGARPIDAEDVALGPSRDVYAFYRGTIQRNLYRILIP